MSYRLIDSNAIAIKCPEVNEMPCVFANLPDGMNGQFIDAQPERKKGKWIYVDDGDTRYDTYWCSECRHKITVDSYRVDDIGFVLDDMKFCPNCGARMDGEQNE